MNDLNKQLKISYYWDLDFQADFILDDPEDRRPFIALAGGILHGDLYSKYRELMKKHNAIELRRKKDFKKRDQGYSINRAIRNNNLKIVKVFDQQREKYMRASPDIVDYRKDSIIDLKTYFLKDSTPPDEGGIFITSKDAKIVTPTQNTCTDENTIPKGYEDGWGDLKKRIESKLNKKYESQMNRYHDAYYIATNRHPSMNIYVVLYLSQGTYYHDEEYLGLRREEPKGFSSDP